MANVRSASFASTLISRFRADMTEVDRVVLGRIVVVGRVVVVVVGRVVVVVGGRIVVVGRVVVVAGVAAEVVGRAPVVVGGRDDTVGRSGSGGVGGRAGPARTKSASRVVGGVMVVGTDGDVSIDGVDELSSGSATRPTEFGCGAFVGGAVNSSDGSPSAPSSAGGTTFGDPFEGATMTGAAVGGGTSIGAIVPPAVGTTVVPVPCTVLASTDATAPPSSTPTATVLTRATKRACIITASPARKETCPRKVFSAE